MKELGSRAGPRTGKEEKVEGVRWGGGWAGGCGLTKSSKFEYHDAFTWGGKEKEGSGWAAGGAGRELGKGGRGPERGSSGKERKISLSGQRPRRLSFVARVPRSSSSCKGEKL